MQLKVRVYGDKCLRQKCSPVREVGPGERMLIAAMLETMHAQKGIGLAAPQVGVNKRIFVADVGDGPVAFVNPKIVKRVGKAVMEEGCLSIPGVNVEVERSEQVFVEYADENGQKMQGVFNGLFARVVQHENDHLDGKLIVDYASETVLKNLQPKLDELKAKQKGKDGDAANR